MNAAEHLTAGVRLVGERQFRDATWRHREVQSARRNVARRDAWIAASVRRIESPLPNVIVFDRKLSALEVAELREVWRRAYTG